jgi:hypothetical protein
MAIIVFVIVGLTLLWALLLLAVSGFFRGIAFAAIGVSFLNLAHVGHDTRWLVSLGVVLIIFPVATTFRRKLFGE